MFDTVALIDRKSLRARLWMKLTVSLEECKNPSFPLSPPHQFHSEFVTREIGFADKRSKLKAVDGTRKLHFIRSKQTSLTIPAAQGEGGLEAGGRGKEGAKPHRTQSATDRKIKEHDAVGSRARARARHRFAWCERENGERTPPAREKYQKSRVHHVSALSPGLRSSPRGKTRPKLFAPTTPVESIYLREATSFYIVEFRVGLPSFYYYGSKDGWTIVLLPTYLPSDEVAVNVTTCNKKNGTALQSGMSIVEFAITSRGDEDEDEEEEEKEKEEEGEINRRLL